MVSISKKWLRFMYNTTDSLVNNSSLSPILYLMQL